MSTPAPLRLFAYDTGWGVPFESAAPFPMKLATWLRMADIPYAFVVENRADKGPKGKAPWIEQGDLRMGDSSLIIAHLSEAHGVDLDADLTDAQRAVGTAVQRMLEEHYHQCFEHQLFFGDGADRRIAAFAESVPLLIRGVFPALLRRAFRTQLHARGMGRHPESVIIEQGCADLDALAELIGDGPFLFGDRPTTFDACAFGFLSVTVYVDGANPLFRHAADAPRLTAYCERIRARWFPETLAEAATHDGAAA